jgi:hypothetical protein
VVAHQQFVYSFQLTVTIHEQFVEVAKLKSCLSSANYEIKTQSKKKKKKKLTTPPSLKGRSKT